MKALNLCLLSLWCIHLVKVRKQVEVFDVVVCVDACGYTRVV